MIVTKLIKIKIFFCNGNKRINYIDKDETGFYGIQKNSIIQNFYKKQNKSYNPRVILPEKSYEWTISKSKPPKINQSIWQNTTNKDQYNGFAFQKSYFFVLFYIFSYFLKNIYNFFFNYLWVSKSFLWGYTKQNRQLVSKNTSHQEVNVIAEFLEN